MTIGRMKNPDMLKIRQEVIYALMDHAREESPLEACGYLGEKDGVVVAAYRLTNADAATDHFSLKPEEQFATLRRMRAEGITLRAVYHSHPASEASPSQEDIRLAYDQEISYVIVSLLGPDQTVRSFRIKENRVSEERLNILTT